MKKLRPGEMVQIKTVEELLGVVNEESAMDIEIYKISSFKGHPFKVLDDDKMLELVESIKARRYDMKKMYQKIMHLEERNLKENSFKNHHFKTIHRWKKAGALLMEGVLLLSVAGCEKKKKVSEAASTQEILKESHSLEDYVAEGVTAPENFDTMIYPLEALTVEYYSQRLPYYTEGVDTDSFWFSMAVLSSLLSEKEYVTPILSEEYNYYEQKEMDAFASALYVDYAKGLFSMPELGEGNAYADYDEELEKYGLLNGNIGYLSIYITGCNSGEDQYILDTQLISKETNHTLAEFQITVVPKEDYESGDLFAYSVSDFIVLRDLASENMTENTEEKGPTAEDDYDEVDGEEITEAVGGETEPGSDEDWESQVTIDQEEALALAKGYLGDEDATYTYKEMVTIGEFEYYDFSVSGSSSTSTDVLVCVNGIDVVSGVQNEDGSWSFDQ